jgi:hypothetical protein
MVAKCFFLENNEIKIYRLLFDAIKVRVVFGMCVR